MSKSDIIDEIKIELYNINLIVNELILICKENISVEPAIRDKTAAGSFLAQFYNGIENILVRISKYKNVDLPKGELWHMELFKRYCEPPYENLPLIFDKELETIFSSYRRFRHIVHHGYGFQLKWEMMRLGVDRIEIAFQNFSKKILDFIKVEGDN
jgi:hypothetical protein